MQLFKSVKTLPQSVKRYAANRDGSVGMMFAAALVPVVAVVGIAIDYSRAQHVAVQLQAATDAAAMAAAKASADKRQLTAENVFDANFGTAATAADGTSGPNTPKATKHNASVTSRIVTPGANSVTVKATASVPTVLMKLVNTNSIELSAESTVHYGGKKLELAIVLDTTGSMNARTTGNKTKLDELKATVPTILDIVMPEGLNNQSRVALVPFSNYINVGSHEPHKLTGRAYPYHTKRCVLERKRGPRPNESAPDNGVDEFWISTRNSTCSHVKPITPLTSDRSVLDAAMQNLRASGATAGHLGIQWGWHAISPEWADRWPAGSAPVGYSDETTIKALVILTDGNFTEFHIRKNGSSPNCNGSRDCAPSRHEAKKYCDHIKSRMGFDNRESVLIFTIGFGLEPEWSDAGKKARNTMKYCASYVDKNLRDGQEHGVGLGKEKHFYFPVTEKDLEATFATIGNALTDAVTKPRLTN